MRSAARRYVLFVLLVPLVLAIGTARAQTPSPSTGDESVLLRALGARLFDYGLVVGGSAAIQFGTSAAFGVPSPAWFEQDTARLSGWAALTMSVPLWTYFTVLDAAPFNATLGKRLFDLRVMNDDGSPLSLPTSLLRTALTFVGWELAHVAMFIPRNFVTQDPAAWQPIGLSVATAWLVLDLLVTVVTGGRKGMADLIVGTRVVRAPPPVVHALAPPSRPLGAPSDPSMASDPFAEHAFVILGAGDPGR